MLLYKSKHKHRNALELLEKLGKGPKTTSLSGPSELIKYMRQLGKEYTVIYPFSFNAYQRYKLNFRIFTMATESSARSGSLCAFLSSGRSNNIRYSLRKGRYLSALTPLEYWSTCVYIAAS